MNFNFKILLLLRRYNLTIKWWFDLQIFFVLNHKYSHISLLHVAHHALMPIGLWYGVRHEPGKFVFMLYQHEKISSNKDFFYTDIRIFFSGKSYAQNLEKHEKIKVVSQALQVIRYSEKVWKRLRAAHYNRGKCLGVAQEAVNGERGGSRDI